MMLCGTHNDMRNTMMFCGTHSDVARNPALGTLGWFKGQNMSVLHNFNK